MISGSYICSGDHRYRGLSVSVRRARQRLVTGGVIGAILGFFVLLIVGGNDDMSLLGLAIRLAVFFVIGTAVAAVKMGPSDRR
jgi:O-antigen ligase